MPLWHVTKLKWCCATWVEWKASSPLVETDGAKRHWGDQPQNQRLVHQPLGTEEALPHLDDGRLLCTSTASLHPHLPGVPDYYVSEAVNNGIQSATKLKSKANELCCCLPGWLWANLKGRWWRDPASISICSSWSPWGASPPSSGSPGSVLPPCDPSPTPMLSLSWPRAQNQRSRRWSSRGSVASSWPSWLVGAAIYSADADTAGWD